MHGKKGKANPLITFRRVLAIFEKCQKNIKKGKVYNLLTFCPFLALFFIFIKEQKMGKKAKKVKANPPLIFRPFLVLFLRLKKGGRWKWPKSIGQRLSILSAFCP